MKDKKIRVLCAVTSLISILAIVPIMFDFFEISISGYEGSGYYSEAGYQIYTDKEQPINIFLGVLGLIALLWDLVYGAYALIDGRYRNLTWRIARYGYFFGIVAGFINFAFIVSLMFYFTICTCSIIFLVLTAAAIILKFFLIFTKDEASKIQSEN